MTQSTEVSCHLFSLQKHCQLTFVIFADLSKNKLSELPAEVTRFSALEKLNLYHNVVRFIPDTVVYLQCLTYLDLSRNQLSVLPAHLCKLPLQVLLVSHNRLVSLPEEINQLTELVELDASSNQYDGVSYFLRKKIQSF